MQNYEQAIEIAITGVGVVFLALASLTLVTLLICRYTKSDNVPNMATSEGPPNDDDPGIESKSDDDPMLTAAMVAAIQIADGRWPGVGGGTLSSTRLPGFGIWQSVGRQLLIQSQGLPRNQRTLGK